jgi:hypothetical protein
MIAVSSVSGTPAHLKSNKSLFFIIAVNVTHATFEFLAFV